jgi:uncharacterized protein YbjT (DUF2867 family)
VATPGTADPEDDVDVAIAGGHGQIALLVSRLLSQRGDGVRGIIRNPDQSDDLLAVGARPIVLDLEAASAAELGQAIADADAVVFAAGAGPGSGAKRKETVDHQAAVTLRRAAESAGVPRYVMISAIRAADPPEGDDVHAIYLRAKARADADLMASALAWTVVRPGELTDDPATGRVLLGERVERARIPREDVAAVIVAALDDPAAVGRVVGVVSGETPVSQAFAAASD